MSSGTASGCYSASPLGSGVSALPVSVQGYSIVVGAGGAGSSLPAPSPTTNPGNRGSNSTFSTITSTGGGSGQQRSSSNLQDQVVQAVEPVDGIQVQLIQVILPQ